MENPKHSLRDTILEFSSYKNRKSKVTLCWVGARKRKKRTLFVPFILSEGILEHLRFISMYSVLNALSEYIHFYISKSIISYTFLHVFKIVESLLCILEEWLILESHEMIKVSHIFVWPIIFILLCDVDWHGVVLKVKRNGQF